MNTYEGSLFEKFCGNLKKDVLQPISQHLTTINVQMSVEDLAAVIKAPCTPSGAVSGPVATTTPGLATNPGSSMLSIAGLTQYAPQPGGSGKSKGSKVSVPAQPVPENERCRYKYTRGKSTGSRCESRAEPGQPFCKECKEKKAAQKQLSTEPGTTQTPSQGLSNLMSFQNLTQPLAPKASNIEVTNVGSGLYCEPKNSLALKTGKHPKDFICVGIWDSKSQEVAPITPEKMEVCAQLGISYVNPATKPGETLSTGSLPPLVSGQQFLGLPMTSGLIPTPSLNTNKILGLSSLPPISSLPGVSSITDLKGIGEPEDDDDNPEDDDDQDD